MNVPPEAIAAAAAWWAGRLGTLTAGQALPNPRRYTAAETGRFRVALEATIADHLAGDEPALRTHRAPARFSTRRDVVRVDYDPDGTLCAAAETAGITIDWTALPAKTTMILRGFEVIVSDGYAAPYEPIWTPRP